MQTKKTGLLFLASEMLPTFPKLVSTPQVIFFTIKAAASVQIAPRDDIS